MTFQFETKMYLSFGESEGEEFDCLIDYKDVVDDKVMDSDPDIDITKVTVFRDIEDKEGVDFSHLIINKDGFNHAVAAAIKESSESKINFSF
jgi:hypothetical protein